MPHSFLNRPPLDDVLDSYDTVLEDFVRSSHPGNSSQTALRLSNLMLRFLNNHRLANQKARDKYADLVGQAEDYDDNLGHGSSLNNNTRN